MVIRKLYRIFLPLFPINSIKLNYIMRLPQLVNIVLILTVLTMVSCEDKNDPVIYHFVNPSESHIEFEGLDESLKTIEIEADEKWNVSDIPEWIVVEVNLENNRVEIAALPNKSASDRESKIKIFTDNVEQFLTISQKGKDMEKEPFSWHAFPVNSMESFSVSGNETNGFSYNFEALSLFIRPTMKNDAYLGNVINRQSSSVLTFETFHDFVYLPITMAAVGGSKFFFSENELPSKKETDRLRQEMIDDLPQQSISFSYSSEPVLFRSYNYLRFLGMSNLGIDPVALISEKNDPEDEMQKAYGLIYSYNLTIFQTAMDYPIKLIENEPDEDFIADHHLSYISAINYGQTAFLIVESDEAINTTKGIVRKIIAGELLSDEENAMVEKMDVHYLAFSPDDEIIGIQSADNFEAIQKYTEIKDNSVIPLSFQVSDYATHGVAYLNYRWKHTR